MFWEACVMEIEVNLSLCSATNRKQLLSYVDLSLHIMDQSATDGSDVY